MKKSVASISAFLLIGSCSSYMQDSKADTYNTGSTSTNTNGAHKKYNFSVGSNTIFCASVTISQELWPVPVDLDSRTGMGLFFVRQLQIEMSKKGVPLKSSNFKSDPEGLVPECNHSEVVEIQLSYQLDRNRKPFIVYQTVQKGDLRIERKFTRDIEAEWKDGRLPRLQKLNAMQMAINNDLSIRASNLSKIF